MNGLCTMFFVVFLFQLKIENAEAVGTTHDVPTKVKIVQVIVGDNYSFDCGITGTNINKYQWQKQISLASSLHLYDDLRYKGTQSNIMTISNIVFADAGTYKCVVTFNSGDFQTSSTVTLEVVSQGTVINGNWGPWTSWSGCSVTCGGGSQTRTRLCNNPPPANGGSDCSGSGTDSQSCYTGGCPVNGNWGSWTSWSGCSVTCEGGTQTRTRLCNNPPPANGGSDCSGSGTEPQSCNTGGCPINGNWGSWTSWSGCSVTCEEGSQTRTGLCNNPVPANGGSDCSGSGSESQTCHTGVDCPINGNWGTWTSWSVCSGTQTRTGQCTNPAPTNGGSDCVGSGTESQSCYSGLSCQASTSSLNEKSQSAIIGVLVAVVIILLIALVVLIIYYRRRMKESSSLQTVIKDNAQGSRHEYANDLVNEHVSYLKLDRRSGGGTSVTETSYDGLKISNDDIGKDDKVYYEIKPETA